MASMPRSNYTVRVMISNPHDANTTVSSPKTSVWPKNSNAINNHNPCTSRRRRHRSIMSLPRTCSPTHLVRFLRLRTAFPLPQRCRVSSIRTTVARSRIHAHVFRLAELAFSLAHGRESLTADCTPRVNETRHVTTSRSFIPRHQSTLIRICHYTASSQLVSKVLNFSRLSLSALRLSSTPHHVFIPTTADLSHHITNPLGRRAGRHLISRTRPQHFLPNGVFGSACFPHHLTHHGRVPRLWRIDILANGGGGVFLRSMLLPGGLCCRWRIRRIRIGILYSIALRYPRATLARLKCKTFFSLRAASGAFFCQLSLPCRMGRVGSVCAG